MESFPGEEEVSYPLYGGERSESLIGSDRAPSKILIPTMSEYGNQGK